MPTTGVSVAFAGLLAAALLGREFDRWSVSIVLLAAALPDLDVFLGYYRETLHNAVLHNLFLPAALSALLFYDLRVRENSWLRTRWGDRGVRIAWVSLAAFTLAGVGMDLLNIEGAAALWPIDGTYYSVVGKIEVNNKEGFVQTFVELNLSGEGPLVSVGTHPPQYVPRLPYNTAVGRYRVMVVESGWQLLLLLAAPLVLAGRMLTGGSEMATKPADGEPEAPDEAAVEGERPHPVERQPED